MGPPSPGRHKAVRRKALSIPAGRQVEVRLAGRIDRKLRGRLCAASDSGFELLPPRGTNLPPEQFRFDQVASIRELDRIPVIHPLVAILLVALFAGTVALLLWLASDAP